MPCDSCLQAWWRHRQAVELSVAHRTSTCFLRRVLSHVTSCVHDANGFLELIAGLSETCGLSKRDVSQCSGPLDRVIVCLSSIQLSAGAGAARACIHLRVRVRCMDSPASASALLVQC